VKIWRFTRSRLADLEERVEGLEYLLADQITTGSAQPTAPTGLARAVELEQHQPTPRLRGEKA